MKRTAAGRRAGGGAKTVIKPCLKPKVFESGYVSSAFCAPPANKPLPSCAAASVTPGGEVRVIAYKLQLPRAPALTWKCARSLLTHFNDGVTLTNCQVLLELALMVDFQVHRTSKKVKANGANVFKGAKVFRAFSCISYRPRI